MEKHDIKNWFIANFDFFESKLNGNRDLAFHQVRKDAISKFSQLSFPTTRDEEWKYTNIAPILKHKFELAQEIDTVDRAALKPFLIDGVDANLLVFVNGHFKPELSSFEDDPKKFKLSNLSQAMVEYSDFTDRYLAKHAKYEEDIFTALNTAFTTEGTFIHVAKNVTIDKPIHILNISTHGDRDSHVHPRNLFVFERGSQAKVLESHHGMGSGTYLTNSVTEIMVDANSNIEHVVIQNESLSSFHINRRIVQLEEDSTYSNVTVDLGGAIVRNNVDMVFHGENGEANLYGFFFGKGNQLIDTHSLIDHAVPHCQSNELFKGILDNRSRGVFNGKVMVRRDAQKTNAFQENKTLLLSDEATINTKPQLEIFADDVKCSHGATIGQLDDEALFYLRTRGIPENEANAMLQQAFAGDVFEHISDDHVRHRVEELVIECFRRDQKDLPS